MSWGWRSKETYGDKSANFEGGEAEKPAADEGAESRKKKIQSIWEDTDDKWWEQYDKTRSTGGISSSHVRDESYRAYSYDDAFDDSDARWYRRNSFRYDSYRDYSPSRLFRSSFSSIGFGSFSYSSSGDNELKNKAIQALRSLTRNANTVANKSAKINYTVKFSGGADSNGVADTFGAKTGKQQEQTIYVSPDELANTKTDDENDAIIDALTGFVLLRVQISQGVDRSVIEAVNATSMTAFPMRFAGEIATRSINAENAAELATFYADDYAAGLLAKSMLTRLARREVIKDWGGFAPYFVRHAKKFAAMRENLLSKNEDGKLSVELLTAQIAYNFVSDENPISLEKAVEDIVAKHLGEELPAEELLVACRELVAELRVCLDDSGKRENGEIEAALNAITEMVASENSSTAAENHKKLEDHLEDVANFMDDIFTAGWAEASDPGNKAAKDRNNKISEEINNVKLAKKLVEGIQTFGTREAHGSLKCALDHASPDEVGKSKIMAQLQYTRAHIDNLIGHYSPRIKELLERNKLDLNTIASMNNPVDDATPELATAGSRDYVDRLLEFEKALEAAARQEIKRLRQEYAASLLENAKVAAHLAQKIDEKRAELEKLEERAQELACKDPTAAGSYAALKDAVAALDAAKNWAAQKEEAAKTAAAAKKLPRAATQLTLACRDARVTSEQLHAKLYETAGSLVCTSSSAMNCFMNHAHHAAAHANYDTARAGAEYKIDKSWHAEGKEAFFAAAGESEGDFTTALINQTHQELLKQLLKQLQAFGKRPKAAGASSGASDDDEEASGGGIPSAFEQLTAEQKAQINNVAASLGMTGEALYKILQQHAEKGGRGANAKAEQLGQQIKEKLIEPAAKISPVDEQLFGEQVKNSVKSLLGSALDNVHDEATHNIEEEFVAYLSHNDARPKIKVINSTSRDGWARTAAKQILKANRGAVDRIRDALIFQSSKRTGEVYGLTSGDLDEGSLHKLKYDSEYIWSQKTLTRLPDVAVGILVDQSGSMGSGGKIEQAREMCIVLAEAVKQIQGVHLHIYGHTANRHGFGSDLQLFEHYSSYGDAKSADLSGLGGIAALSNNYDGYAIKETAKRLALDPAKKKYLFVIADGLPSGHGYGGEEAEKHVTSVCTYVRNKLKISTYAFGVGVRSPDHISKFKTQYGENNVVFISTVKQALPKIVRFLRNVLHKERNFVDASAD